jgi:hypothetical protein
MHKHSKQFVWLFLVPPDGEGQGYGVSTSYDGLAQPRKSLFWANLSY